MRLYKCLVITARREHWALQNRCEIKFDPGTGVAFSEVKDYFAREIPLRLTIRLNYQFLRLEWQPNACVFTALNWLVDGIFMSKEVCPFEIETSVALCIVLIVIMWFINSDWLLIFYIVVYHYFRLGHFEGVIFKWIDVSANWLRHEIRYDFVASYSLADWSELDLYPVANFSFKIDDILFGTLYIVCEG